MTNKKPITSVLTNKQANTKLVSKFSKHAVANQRIHMQRMQNVLLIWLDNNIDDDDNVDRSNTIKQLKRVVNNVSTFTDGQECFDLIQTIVNN
ncbi:unnamed protein product [Adineta steineri]|uniref:Uncharacterized protein n=1 Tax=Adineta steineri TaxID=433720 RepID=A0A814Y6F6_9BILA|nr:unnamed protein product [Adineta steineri]CAF1515864.1 unnamed protein product [Adineta steineri]